MTLEQLKARAYDLIHAIELMQQELRAVNVQVQQMQKAQQDSADVQKEGNEDAE